MALEKLGEMKRQEFESAIPDVGSLLALVSVCTVSRHNREAASREVYQQQICQKCSSVVGMMMPVDSQFRTYCLPCRAYRKIVPKDLELSDEEWAAVCGTLDFGYQEWVRRGREYNESVTPVDRYKAWPINGMGPVYEIDPLSHDGMPRH